MSQGVSLPFGRALVKAQALTYLLSDACERIEIAGSLRRLKAEVHDIEIVAVPKWEVTAGDDLWGTPVEIDLLEDKLAGLRSIGTLRLRDVEAHKADGSVEITHRDGDSYKALEYEGIPVDLFIVRPPAEWGVIFAIRTGPGDWNQRLVTDCQKYLRRVEKGRVYRGGQYVPCPEEEDFFAAIGQDYLPPNERSVDKVRIKP